MNSLNIVGAGAVGKTLGRLWSEAHFILIDGVRNRTALSTKEAINAMGAGRPIKTNSEFAKADLWMLSVSDDALLDVVESLKEIDFSSSVVFHCSGAVSSEVLRPLNARGAASLHPIKSFLGSKIASENFIGTYCTMEGDLAALRTLAPLIESIRGIPVEIPSEKKLLYHSAMVMVSNYIAALIFSGEELLIRSGVSKELALKMISPLAAESLGNCLKIGPTRALTGPIQRGEVGVVGAELEELSQTGYSNVYAELGKITLKIARDRGLASEVAEKIESLLLQKVN